MLGAETSTSASFAHADKISNPQGFFLVIFNNLAIQRLSALFIYLFIYPISIFYELLNYITGCHPLISSETTTDTGSLTALLDKASFQLGNNIFPHGYYHWLCIFASDEQAPSWWAYKKICTCRGEPQQ